LENTTTVGHLLWNCSGGIKITKFSNVQPE